jgi:hypothetical protein
MAEGGRAVNLTAVKATEKCQTEKSSGSRPALHFSVRHFSVLP